MAKLNISTSDAIFGDHGPLKIDQDGDFSLAGKKLAWMDNVTVMVDDGSGTPQELTFSDLWTMLNTGQIPTAIINGQPKTIQDIAEDLQGLASVSYMTLKGSVADEAARLALTASPGDVYKQEDTGVMWVYSESGWIDMGGAEIDLSGYATISQLNKKQAATTSDQEGLVLTGGILPGTFGTIGVDNNVTSDSNNLITSGAVANQIVNMTNTYQPKLVAGENITIDDSNVISAAGGGEITETDPIALPKLNSHIETDAYRWDDYYMFKTQEIQFDEIIQGRKLDIANAILNTAPNTTETYSFDSTKQIILAVRFTNHDGLYTEIKYGENLLFTSNGLQENVNFQWAESLAVNASNDLTITNATLIEIIDSNLDPDSIFLPELSHSVTDTQYQENVNTPVDVKTGEQLVTATELSKHSDFDLTNISMLMQNMNSQMSDMRSQILALQASVSNKTLDTNNSANIESEAQGGGYTVSNALGGQITFESPLILLAGVGTMYVNGVSVWTNVGLTIGLGVTGDTIEVNNGDVITCSGMSSVIFTPYKAA